MAANVRKNMKSRKKRINFAAFSTVLFFISTLLYLTSCLFLHQYNNILTSKTQELNRQIAEVQKQNDAIAVNIEELASVERINEIAAADDITHIQDNIITINDGDTAEEK